jgi:protein-tyrosine-phosphatase
MAEGFARAYGSDVLDAVSAGLAPGMMVDPVTIRVMAEKGVDLTPHFPKDVAMAAARGVDLVVNMSGYPAPAIPGVSIPGAAGPGAAGPAMRTWAVRDPHMHPEKVHREVRDHVENLVMQLVLELRGATRSSSTRSS